METILRFGTKRLRMANPVSPTMLLWLSLEAEVEGVLGGIPGCPRPLPQLRVPLRVHLGFVYTQDRGSHLLS